MYNLLLAFCSFLFGHISERSLELIFFRTFDFKRYKILSVFNTKMNQSISFHTVWWNGIQETKDFFSNLIYCKVTTNFPNSLMFSSRSCSSVTFESFAMKQYNIRYLKSLVERQFTYYNIRNIVYSLLVWMIYINIHIFLVCKRERGNQVATTHILVLKMYVNVNDCSENVV